MAAERTDRENVGLHAGAAGRIRCGEGQHDRRRHCANIPAHSMAENQVQYKTWMCLICGWVYDEAAGLPDEGNAAGPRWEDVPMNWPCPHSGPPQQDFEILYTY